MRMFQSAAEHSSEQSTAHYSVQLTANCIAAKRCFRHNFKLIWVSPTTEDTNFQRHYKRFFPFKTRIEWPPSWPQSQVFRAYVFNTCNIEGNIQALRLKELLRWQSIFFTICRFCSSIPVLCKFSFHEQYARDKFDSGLIFLDQSQFFATHRNRRDCFILYR